TFAAYLAHYVAFYTLPLGAGLALRGVFDALSGRAPAGANAWTFVALVAAAELARLVVIATTVRFGATAVMFAIAPWITAVVVAPLVAAVALTDRLTRRAQRLRAAAREAGARVAGFVAELFGAVEALRLAGAESHAVAHLDALNDARSRAAIRDQLATQVLDGLRANLASLGVGAALLLAAGAMRASAFTVGDFVLFAGYIPLAVGAPRWIGFLLARRRLAEVSLGRMEALMEGAPPAALTALPQVRAAPDAEPLQSL